MATTKYGIPEIIVGQAQKEVTHNEALAYVDTLLKNPLTGENTTTPPVSPVEGELHTIGTSATGVWVGQDGNVAAFINSVWIFFAPFTDLVFYSSVSNNFIIYNGVTWNPLTVASGVAWGNITGTLSTQTDLQAALNAKEDSLGNPTVDGQILSSTIAGVRTWITSAAGSSTWGSITGLLSDQTDLQAALDLKAAITYVDSQYALLEPDLGNPTVDGDILSSTIAGVRSWITPAAGGGGGGKLLQRVSTNTFLNSGTSGLMAYDTTIPQASEGSPLFSLGITPLSSTSTLVLCMDGWFSASNIGYWIVAGYSSADINAHAARATYSNGVNRSNHSGIMWEETGHTAGVALNYNIRFGPTSGFTLWYARNGNGTDVFGNTITEGMFYILEIEA